MFLRINKNVSEVGTMKKMYVDAVEVSNDWGVSKATAYRMIKSMNENLLRRNPNLIVVAGKVNRKFYEECCETVAK